MAKALGRAGRAAGDAVTGRTAAGQAGSIADEDAHRGQDDEQHGQGQARGAVAVARDAAGAGGGQAWERLPVHVIPDQLPWWVAGPGVGLCVVALYALAGVKLGVSGGWLQQLFLIERRPITESWWLWFTGALVVGAFVAPVRRQSNRRIRHLVDWGHTPLPPGSGVVVRACTREK